MYWDMKKTSFCRVSHFTQDRKITGQKTNMKGYVSLRLDMKQITYGRVADNLFSALEEIGGFHESLMHIGFILVCFF